MLLQGVFIMLIFVKAFAKNGETGENVMKVKAINNVLIDKDTIITRNMNLKQKSRDKASTPQSLDPDWSYSSFPKEVKNHVEQFKRNMSECLKEVQANDKRTVKSLSPKKESPVHGECLIACVLKRNGVIEKGKIYKENLLSLVRKFYEKDDKLMKKLEKHVDRCIEISARNKDDCALASQLNDCTNDLMSYSKNKIIVN